MANLRLSDGRTISFPDGLTPDQVRKIVDAAKAAPPAAMSAKEEFDALPWYGKAAQAADDTMRFLANGMTLGYADKIAGYMGGEGTDAERAKTARAKERAGSAGTAAEIVGTMLPASGLANSVLSATRYVPKAAQGLLGRSAAAGIDGATLGAIQATGYDEDPLKGAAVGFAGGLSGNVLGEGIGTGLNKLAGAFNPKPNIMTPDELKAVGDKAFKRAEATGVVYRPEAIGKLRDDVYDLMAEFGYDPALQPGANVVFNRLQRLAEGGNVNIKGLNTLRKVAQNGYDPKNPANNQLLRDIVGKIDDFAANADESDVLVGQSKAASEALKEGRDYWSRFRKVEKVDEVLDKAGRRAAVSGTGGNTQNATKQELNRLLNDKKFMRGFKSDEKEALRNAVFPSTGEQAMRLASAFDPTKGVLRAILGTSITPYAPQIAVPVMVAGYGARKAGEAMAKRNAEMVKKLISVGGNKAALLGEPNAVQRLVKQYEPLLGRAIMSGALVGTAGR